MQKLRIEVLSERHIDEASRILPNNFVIYPIWKNYNLNEDQIIVLMRGRVIKAIEIDQSFVIFDENQMIGISLHLDMLDYMTYPSMPNNLEFSKKLKNATQKLDGSIDLSQIKRGQHIYGTFSALDSKYTDKGYSLYLYWMCLSIIRGSGWKKYFGRCSNIAAVKGMQKVGAKQVGQQDIMIGDAKQKVVLMQIDIQNFKLSYSMIKYIIESKNKKPQAKL